MTQDKKFTHEDVMKYMNDARKLEAALCAQDICVYCAEGSEPNEFGDHLLANSALRSCDAWPIHERLHQEGKV